MTQTKVLDHGYLKLIESWGSDERIIEAARMSTGKGFQGWGPKHQADCAVFYPSNVDSFGIVKDNSLCNCKSESGDEKLLSYLYTHKHHTPFEMCGATFEIQAPIFVFREWHRHRTQSYNELSARYTPLPDVNYKPEVERCIVVQGSNKQATSQSGRTPTHEEVLDWLENYVETAYYHSQVAYARGLEIGIPKEVARITVPVARYSRMRASANLRNWLGFLTLRMAPNAQWEIRQYANHLHSMLAELFPRTLELFDKERA